MRKKLRAGVFEIFAISLALFVSIPLYLVFINAFKSHRDIVTQPLAFPTFDVGFSNLIEAYDRMNILLSYSVTLSIAGIALLIGIGFSSLAAYALARNNQPIFKSLYWLYVASILLPIQSALIPVVFLLRDLNMQNSILGISFVYIAVISPFALFMFTGFIRAIPFELEESAYIDGSSPLRTFFKIIFPLIKPVTATLIILQFIYIWNDILLPLVLLNSAVYPTVSMSLLQFFGARGMGDLSLLFGGIFLTMAPIITLFLFFQRYFIKGLAAGSLKG